MNLLDKPRSIFTGMDTVSLDPAFKRARRELDMFMEASLLLIEPARTRRPPLRERLRWFFLGAAECLSRRHRLDNAQGLRLAMQAVQCPDSSLEDPSALLHELGSIAEQPGSADVMTEGGATLERWLVGKDNNAPLRLAQLANDWS